MDLSALYRTTVVRPRGQWAKRPRWWARFRSG